MTNQEKIFTEVAGVTKKAWPFKIMAKPNNKILAILIHGFSGSPHDLHPLAEHLVNFDIDVEAPLLAGHGGSLERLMTSGYCDWIDSVESVLLKNIDKYDKIFLVGYSFGANIALHLSWKYSQIVSGVISLGVFIYKRQEFRTRLILPLARLFPKFNYSKSWISEEQKKLYPTFGLHTEISMTNVVDVAEFIDDYTKKEMAKITVPVLVIHSRDDGVSHPRGSEYLFNNLKVKDKSLFILNKNEHNPFLNNRRDFLFMKIFNFIKNH